MDGFDRHTSQKETNINDDGNLHYMASLDLARLRKDVEPFQSELMEEFYRNYAGLKDEMATVEIYDRFAHLFSGEAVSVVKEAMETADQQEDTRWMRYLRAFSTMGHLDSAVKRFTDSANTFEAQSVVELDGERIPYRGIPVRLSNEPDASRRKRLFEAKLVETEKLNAILAERMGTVHDLSIVLGFKGYKDLCSILKGVNYRALEEQMEELLRRTEGLYVDAMGYLLEERAGIPLGEAWSYDIPFAFRGEDFDPHFQKDKLVEAFHTTLRGMGIKPSSYENIKMDMEERPKKTPRPFCAPVKVPDDVRLVIMATGGWKDYGAFFHEGGHAFHFGSTKRTLPAEYRYLGDNSVTEAFAFLFNRLLNNKLWLEKVLGMEQPQSFVGFTLTNELMFLRRYAAKLVYEIKLHNAKISSEFQEVYRSCLQKSLKFRHTEKHFLEDVDDGLYCADYLRAWILEAQIRAALVDEFGEEWFLTEKAGDLLKQLWSYGQKYTADEMVKTLGYVDLDMDPLVAEIERGLSESG